MVEEFIQKQSSHFADENTKKNANTLMFDAQLFSR